VGLLAYRLAEIYAKKTYNKAMLIKKISGGGKIRCDKFRIDLSRISLFIECDNR